MDIPSLLVSALGTFARWLLNILFGLAAGYLITHNLLTTEQAQTVQQSPAYFAIATLVAGTLSTLLWAIYVKARARYRLLVATIAQPGTSVASVKEAVKERSVMETLQPNLAEVATTAEKAEAIQSRN